MIDEFDVSKKNSQELLHSYSDLCPVLCKCSNWFQSITKQPAHNDDKAHNHI